MSKNSDLPSERAVLAGLCQYGRDAYVDISDIITNNSFYNDSNKIIYACLCHVLLTGDRVDLASLLASASELRLYDSIKEQREIEYIKALFTFNVNLESVRKYAIKLRKLEIIRIGQSLVHKTYSELQELNGTESINKILSTIESPVFEFINKISSSNEEGPVHLFDNGELYLDYLINNPVDNIGIPSPYPKFNASIGGGFRRGGVNLIGARIKQGKSTLGKEIALHVVGKLKIPVLILDTEMSKEDLFHKSISTLTNVNISELETGKFGKDLTKKTIVYNELAKQKNNPFYYVRVAGKDFEEILSIIRRWIHKRVGYDANGKTKNCLVIYDYMKLMDTEPLKSMQEYQAIGFQMSKLSDFCKQLDFPALAFVQLNRDGLTQETSAVASQSDRLVWFAHSFSIFKSKTQEEIAEDGVAAGNKKMVVVETRYGPGMSLGDYINMKMNGSIGKIEEGLFKSELKRQNNEF